MRDDSLDESRGVLTNAKQKNGKPPVVWVGRFVSCVAVTKADDVVGSRSADCSEKFHEISGVVKFVGTHEAGEVCVMGDVL